MEDDDRQRLALAPLTVTALVLLAAYARWAVARPPFSASATVAVVGAGAVAVGLGGLRPPREARPARHVARWALLALALAAWQLLAFVQQPREDHPTLSSLTNAALDTHPVRAAAFVLWLFAARELARR